MCSRKEGRGKERGRRGKFRVGGGCGGSERRMVDQGAASRSSEGGVIVADPHMAGEVIVMQSPGVGLVNGHHPMSSMKLRGEELGGEQSTSSSSSSLSEKSRGFGEDPTADEVVGGINGSSAAAGGQGRSIMDISPGSLFAFHPEQPNFFSQKSRGSSADPTSSSHPTARSLSVDSGIPNLFSFSQMESELAGIEGGSSAADSHVYSHDYHRAPQPHKGHAIGKPPRGLFSPSSFGEMNGGGSGLKTPSPMGRNGGGSFGGFPSTDHADHLQQLQHGSGSAAMASSPAHFHSADGLPHHGLPTAGGARPMMNGGGGQQQQHQHNGGAAFLYHPQGGHPAAPPAVYTAAGLPLNHLQQQQQGSNDAQQQQDRRGAANGYLQGAPEDPAAVYPGGLPNGAAVALPGAPGVPPRVHYFPGYDASGAPMLAVSAHPQGGGLVAPTHFVTAAGMVPINQLMPFHMLRTLAAPAGVPGLEGAMAYAAGPGIPFFVQAAPHALGAAARLYGAGGDRDSREGSPNRPGGKDDDWHYGRGRRHDSNGLKPDFRDKRSGGGGGGAKKRVERDPEVLAALNSDCPSLEEILKTSSVHSLSQDQVGCRFLQLKLDEAGAEAASVILAQAKPYLGDMMTDPFGNYLFQKILEKVSDGERTHILSCVRDQLVDAALNLHGTRSVQRLVELCKSEEQLDMIKQALRRDVVRLCVDANGNHVIQRALQHLGPSDRGFIFDAVSSACVEVSTHRHGCCVMQRCLDAATPEQKRVLVMEVGRNCFQLMQDPYGNYVVQYVLDRCHGDEIRPVTSCPIGRLASLSVQKYSSNVIEKCLEKATEDIQSAYIEEMCLPGNIKHLMQDQYANYVVQRALSVASHSHGMALVEAIRPHLHSMRNTAGGRRIVAKIVKRFPSVDLGNDFVNPR